MALFGAVAAAVAMLEAVRDQRVRQSYRNPQRRGYVGQCMPPEFVHFKSDPRAIGQFGKGAADQIQIAARQHDIFRRGHLARHRAGDRLDIDRVTLRLDVRAAFAVNGEVADDAVKIVERLPEHHGTARPLEAQPCVLHDIFGLTLVAGDDARVIDQ